MTTKAGKRLVVRDLDLAKKKGVYCVHQHCTASPGPPRSG